MSHYDKLTSAYDKWLTTDLTAEAREQSHAAFEQSDDYLAAYVDYCEVFDSSRAYDKAFDAWLTGTAEADEDLYPREYDCEDMEPDDTSHYSVDNWYGDDT